MIAWLYSLLILLALVSIAWAVLAIPSKLLLGGPSLVLSSAAALISLIPTAISLSLMKMWGKMTSEERLMAVLFGTMIRLGLTVISGMIAFWGFFEIEEHPIPFIIWSLFFYLITLSIETSLILRDTKQPINPLTSQMNGH